MAQAGGIGVVHRNLSPVEQAEARQVKKFESGMVVNPVTIGPDAALAEALALMKAHGISGIPVVKGNGGGPGKLVGILTNRDVRFASDPAQKVAELMTSDNLVTVKETSVDQSEATAVAQAPHRKAAGDRWRIYQAAYQCQGWSRSHNSIRPPPRMPRVGCAWLQLPAWRRRLRNGPNA
jgi:IMP dehydrogenase/GMP reductase